jgi:hypothetical protein
MPKTLNLDLTRAINGRFVYVSLFENEINEILTLLERSFTAGVEPADFNSLSSSELSRRLAYARLMQQKEDGFPNANTMPLEGGYILSAVVKDEEKPGTAVEP